MRLIDRQTVEWQAFEQIEQARCKQRFRCNVQQLDLAVAHLCHIFLILMRGKRAVQEYSRDAYLA